MKVKKYTAGSMPEAMKQIRKELGAEAVILQSRQVNKRKFLGLFKKPQIEVVAVKDPQPIAPKKQVSQKQEMRIKERKDNTNTNIVSPELQELRQVKKLLHQSAIHTLTYPFDYQSAYHYLLEQEVNQPLAKSLIESVMEKYSAKSQPTYQEIVKKVEEEIMERLQAVPFQGLTYNQKLVYFVGPTGVGKTTTIAKLAAESKLKDGKNVAFITADTYRIAAVEQLKTYADILSVPIEVVYSNDDMVKAIHKLSTYDIIFIDTAGRNFREDAYIKQLQEDVLINKEATMFLVLSLTAKSQDLLNIYDQFEPLPISQVIFTKLDETRQVGGMLNIIFKKSIGVGYITNGQDVPDDLVHPTPEFLSSSIMEHAYEN
ncbi:flagellar biosynthesis protein FlhF [Virgibacillus dokdonensis]|uniref:Flagellar biosynthesis protein FlhF n=1 Tax=Virgibacillus dokdonensis TaxID=302167 RepID=A0A3E0X0D7_9BACI|nr:MULTISPECIES: flagellar biosynthesis protein FlhF [Virgibacillus]RFA37725.1 flagellar biosynthesis protein FlhF [Virgibacillus dokdonensis]